MGPRKESSWELPKSARPKWLDQRWQSAESGSVFDRLGWLRQILIGDDLVRGREANAVAGVPREIAEDQGVLRRFGLIQRAPAAVAAIPWRPNWLRDSTSVAVDTLDLKTKRTPQNPVHGDPALSLLGYKDYRSHGQRGAMRAVLLAPAGSVLLVVLPTGAGKSLLAHLPPLLEEGLTVVVVPTVSLAMDQARALKAHRVAGASWGEEPWAYVGGGGVTGSARRNQIKSRVREGSQRILFASPEAVVGGLHRSLMDAARTGHLKRLIVDEAHIVDAWGEGFRPAFQEVAGFRTSLLRLAPSIKTVLLSATITESTRKTLKDLFASDGQLATVCGAQLRGEPAYWLTQAQSNEVRTARVLEALHHLPRPLVLYTSKRDDASDWHSRVQEAGFRRTNLMTGETPQEARERLVDQWSSGEIDMVVATSAFGMGIDQPHVRTIIHATLPESLDRYYQEVGRGGRDGFACLSLLATGPGDEATARSIAKKTYLKPETAYGRWERLFSTARDPATLTTSSIVGNSMGGAMPSAVDDWQDDAHRTIAVNVEVGTTATMHSRKNTYWNFRTLTMMHRTGFAIMKGPALQDTEESHQGRFQLVELKDPQHLDSREWGHRMTQFRQERRSEARSNFSALRDLLSSETCWSELLGPYYQLAGSPRPALACGGCPPCRRSGAASFAHSAVEPPLPWSLGFSDLTKVPPPTWLASGVSFITVPPGRGLEFRTGLMRALRGLAIRGFRQFVLPDSWSSHVPELQRGLPPLLTPSRFHPFLPAVPAVVLCVDAPLPPGVLLNGPPTPRVVLFPDELPDPTAPYRLLRQRLDSRPLKSLLAELSA